MTASLHHIPVLVEEVIFFLNIDPNHYYVDGTFGLGGHANHILTNLSEKGKLIGIERDSEAIKMYQNGLYSSSPLLSVYHDSYHQLPKILKKEGIPNVSGILLDLGLSSIQLVSKSRGFSFAQESSLDMRFNAKEGKTASEMLDRMNVSEIEQILKKYGEERYYKKIAFKIKQNGPIRSTTDLSEIIRKSTPPANRVKTLARVFQAIRIAVNKELHILDQFLKIFIHSLNQFGRVVIISYHSLEDRMVKHSFKQLKQDGLINILTKKPITPTQKEMKLNSRSRSAKLRAAEKR